MSVSSQELEGIGDPVQKRSLLLACFWQCTQDSFRCATMAPEQPTDGSAAAAAPTSAEQQQAGPSTDLDAQIAQGMVDYQNQLLNIDEIR